MLLPILLINSRSQIWATSVLTLGCQIIRYLNPVISGGAFKILIARSCIRQSCCTIKSRVVADLAEVRVSRTHRRPLRATTGFEDREDHRSLGTSSSAITCRAAASLPSRYDL